MKTTHLKNGSISIYRWIGYEEVYILLNPLIELILVAIEVFLDTGVSPSQGLNRKQISLFLLHLKTEIQPISETL